MVGEAIRKVRWKTDLLWAESFTLSAEGLPAGVVMVEGCWLVPTLNDGNKEIAEGEWIVTNIDTGRRKVVRDEDLRRDYEEVE